MAQQSVAEPSSTPTHFYLASGDWFAGVSDAGDLDARDLLLSKVWNGQVIFSHATEEKEWYEDRADQRRFFSRQTYSRHKNNLLRQGLLRNFVLPGRKGGIAVAIHRDLHQGIRYELNQWPLNLPVFHRPYTYLAQRWPVWLGNSDIASRTILLAFFDAWVRQQQAQPPTEVHPAKATLTLSWQQIQHFALVNFGQVEIDKLHKAIFELQVLALLREEAGNSLRYTLQYDLLERKPRWDLAAMAQACNVPLASNQEWIHIVRDLMLHCWEPVTRLQTVWHGLSYRRSTTYLADSTDLLELQKHIRYQRRDRPPPRYNEVLDDYLQKRERQGARLLSTSFQMPAQPIALTDFSLAGEVLRMPVPTAHGVEATQLAIRCRRAPGLTVAEAQEILAATHFIVWQEKAGHDPVAIALVCPKPKPLSIDYGFTVRANQLHQHLDYSQPFAVIIKCARPDPRLELTCCFRLLLRRGVAEGSNPRLPSAVTP